MRDSGLPESGAFTERTLILTSSTDKEEIRRMWWNEKVRPKVKPVFVNFAPEPTDGATPNWPADESREWIAKWSKKFAALSNAEVLEPTVVNNWDEIAAFEIGRAHV